jgi:hypothetical protein
LGYFNPLYLYFWRGIVILYRLVPGAKKGRYQMLQNSNFPFCDCGEEIGVGECKVCNSSRWARGSRFMRWLCRGAELGTYFASKTDVVKFLIEMVAYKFSGGNYIAFFERWH